MKDALKMEVGNTYKIDLGKYHEITGNILGENGLHEGVIEGELKEIRTPHPYDAEDSLYLFAVDPDLGLDNTYIQGGFGTHGKVLDAIVSA